jgi:hypothetical protein
MNPIDTAPLLGYNKNLDYTGFNPVLNYAWDGVAKTVTVTDATAFPAGDAFQNVNVQVHDRFGGTVKGNIAAAAGNTGAMDVSSLNPTKGLAVTATIITNKGLTATGTAHNMQAAGALANYLKAESPAEAVA